MFLFAVCNNFSIKQTFPKKNLCWRYQVQFIRRMHSCLCLFMQLVCLKLINNKEQKLSTSLLFLREIDTFSFLPRLFNDYSSSALFALEQTLGFALLMTFAWELLRSSIVYLEEREREESGKCFIYFRLENLLSACRFEIE